MSHAGRQIWKWRERDTAREESRQLARLRRRGLIQGVAVLALGTLLNRGLGHEMVGRFLVAVGALQTLIAMWRPHLLAVVERWSLRFGRAVGRGLSWLLLAPFWLLVLVPGGLWLKLRGRDPLHRAPLAGGLTAWIPRRRAATAASMARQFLEEDREARSLERPVGTMPAPDLLRDLERGDGAS